MRTPPCTAEEPNYGIVGIMHVLPPALAWLWRLVAPRGHANPSIIQTDGISSEGVGSYWPFATGKKVNQANLLLRQIQATPKVQYILTPNQNIGAWKVGFMSQWVVRDYIARKGNASFVEEQILPARCNVLGHALKYMTFEGRNIPEWLLQVELQREVGEKGYDAGAKILLDFFHKMLKEFNSPDLDDLGKEIIECCLNNGTVKDYENLMPR